MPLAVVREARVEDIPAASQLAGDLVRLHHQWDPQRFMLVPNVEAGYAWWFERELSNPAAVILVAEQPPAGGGEPEIVGYAYGTVEERDWNALLDRAGWLHDIFVLERARKLGVAKALLAGMMQRLADLGAPRLVLVSATQNEAAQRLFAGVGFRYTMVEMTAELPPE